MSNAKLSGRIKIKVMAHTSYNNNFQESKIEIEEREAIEEFVKRIGRCASCHERKPIRSGMHVCKECFMEGEDL